MSTSGLVDCIPYTTTCTIVVRLYTSPHGSLTARTATSSRHDHRPSGDRSKTTSPIGPPDLSADTPTILKCRSEPPKMRPFSQSPRKCPHATLQVNVNLSPHSLHTHTAPHRCQLLDLAQRFPALSTFRNDTSTTGLILEERKRKRSSCVKVTGARLTAARERHEYPGGSGHVCEQRINGVRDRWRSATW